VKDHSAQPGFFTLLGIRVRNQTIRRYSGRGAERYETHRQSSRWAAEARAFEDFYRRIDPKSVLDCPVGTGRWFDIYRSNGASVLGVDISANMLAQATEKVPPGMSVRLERADVLNPTKAAPLGQGHDLIVCSRFVYWLRPHELAIMLGKFHATHAPLLLAGAKVALESGRDHGSGAGGLVRWLDRTRARFYRAVVKQVYKEGELLAIFHANGWDLKEKRVLVTTRSVRYCYYLFVRS
jgi:SAM-dependent methyltransferase